MLREKDLQFCPSVRFERAFNKKYGTNLKVSEDYNLPDGFDSIEGLNKHLKSIYVDSKGEDRPITDVNSDYLHLANNMVKANPKLKSLYAKINKEDHAELVNFVNGVASGFNQSDIEYYSKHHFSGITKGERESAFYKDKIIEVSDAIGLQINWVPSQQTMQTISTAYEKYNNKNYDITKNLNKNYIGSNSATISRYNNYSSMVKEQAINRITAIG
ncbi:MAG: hypothetical protein COV35_06135 [Alphaproteobacteria bacterium CG11_big_fil_rev_8_21_14_0_20_39_49]|nr:MAG: hypothetical protein COV35_06135 [Alphaproteobacteria bacterium CG11_big_fil_rev_8_21_14_0_20_39_49]